MKYRTHTCGQLTAADTGAKVVLSGWVETIRDHGGVLFVDLRDHYGVTQIVVHDDAMLREVSKETVIMVAGEVSLRDEETVNPKLATGHVEVVADKRGIPVLRNNAFYLRLASARTLKDAQNKLKTLSSASSSKLTKQTSRNRSGELKILSERLPNGRTQYFVGQGPFTRYRDAQHALSKARARHTEASVACLPTLVAENTR